MARNIILTENSQVEVLSAYLIELEPKMDTRDVDRDCVRVLLPPLHEQVLHSVVELCHHQGDYS